ncbi:MAG: pyridoxine 5'-phosphate synthase [Candidatus Omnitrophica bacterium]|nr:pyridoxine 5'-phosphate synthase [Candidatus Omnitrophota bacterium]
MKLGVNVDHVATLRKARGTKYPDPVVAALCAEYAGCDSIVVHVREDRRHITERDAILIKQAVKVPLNLEMSVNKGIVDFALTLLPAQATLVPERRLELTTEGGLDLLKNTSKIVKAIARLKNAGIRISLFIDPIKRQITRAKELGVDLIEINTGKYSESKTQSAFRVQLTKIKEAVKFARVKKLTVAAGHGLDYENTKSIVKLKAIDELNIGHSIVSRAVLVGFPVAVSEMIFLIKGKSKL